MGLAHNPEALLISVVITAYNYGRFIEEAIDSVLSQEVPSARVEVVVVDDGSTDDTAERVRNYGSKVRYFHTPNRGQASALNLGFANARGEIISLLDGDDFFLPGKLARVADAFLRDPALGMVHHPMVGWNMQTNERRESHAPLISGTPLENEKDFFWYLAPGTCASFRRKFLDRFLPIPEEIRMLADDYPGWLIVFVAPILALPDCVSVYRVHGQNSFQTNENQMPVETRKHRLRLWQTVIDAKRRWLTANGFTRKDPLVGPFLDRWSLYLENQEFSLHCPGRLRFFSHLMLYNRCYGPHLSWRLRAINYFNAVASLITGYRYFSLLNRWRLRAFGLIAGEWTDHPDP
jgi:glycosyltransferase involved in cell wall biosynthesis